MSGGDICQSLQCNVSYRIVGDKVELIDTTGQRSTVLASQVTHTQLQPAAKVAANFSSAQELADFLDQNFFAG